ncbi:heat shock protein 30D-like [Eublepharis macularius]|uniref:Heat shock protein 30D-like n=1 Tax=Eublepharis macularius TaxID=481883 RepID=A0AA97JP33_EUBMA|nr:heat shock protein 30D-like [Eublepharis macularius]
MARWSREERLRGSHPPPWMSGREAIEYVPVRLPPHSLLDQLASHMQSHLEEIERMRAALDDPYPPLWAGRESCRTRVKGRPGTPVEAGPRGSSSSSDEGGSYRFSLDVAGFAPEELSVKLEGRRLTVRARREKKAEAADGCVSHEYREVRKEVLLPDDANLEAVACTLDGPRLCVEAPRLALPPAEARTIPVTVARAPGSPVAERKAALPASPEDAGGAPDAAAAP